MLNVKTKMAIVSTYLAGVYTSVAAMAREFSVSRKLVYAIYHQVEDRLQGERPGPKGGEVEKLQREKAALANQVSELQGRVAQLEEALRDTVKVTPARVARLRREVVVAPISYDEGERIIAVAYGQRWARSGGWECAFVAEQGAAAGLALEALGIAEQMRRGAADEVFLGKDPVLTVVEPRSLAVLAGKRPDRQAATWVQFLKPFKNLDIVASDQGTGLVGGIKRSGRRHQGDLEHLSWKIAAVEQKVWRQCEAALKNQEHAQAAYQARKIRHKTYEKIKAEVDAQFVQAECYLGACADIYRAFEIVDPDSGQLQTRAESEAHVEAALAMLSGLDAPAAKGSRGLPSRPSQVASLRRYLEGKLAEFFLFLDELYKDLQQLPIVLKDSDSPWSVTYAQEVIVRAVALQKALEKSGSMLVQETYLRTLDELRPLSAQIKDYKQVMAEAEVIVESVLRASSVAEYFNSRLRVHQYVKKHLSQEYLDLMILRYLTTPFQEGARQGKTPLQLLDVQTGGADWHQLIEGVFEQVA